MRKLLFYWTLTIAGFASNQFANQATAAEPIASRAFNESADSAVATSPPSAQAEAASAKKKESGWVYWEPTAEDLAEMKAELEAEQKRTSKSAIGTAGQPSYRILEQEDFGLAGRRRYQLRIRVQRPVNRNEIESICREILSSSTKYSTSDALEFLFYLPQSGHHGHYTAGKAVWGAWSSTEATGKSNKFDITVGNALGNNFPYQKTAVSLAKKQRVFWELVEAQDTNMDPDRSYIVVARRHGITEQEARAIAQEGIHKGWPLPE